ncbi:putative undecaprenyl diphosphate synthase-domain-containing protein [Chiua virens]|nr:putative undecaprenyl diphosphate synthase-domain-containing protein [Chiua virens]
MIIPTALVAFIRSPIAYIKIWLIYLFLDILATGPMPRHISFEMDGNRRYARRLGKGGKEGHPDGFKNLLWVLELCLRLRIHCVTVYAFAIENFKRPEEEVDTIMKLAEERLVEMAQCGYILDRHGVRLNVLGRRELLPPNVQVAIEKAENMTRHNNIAILNVCAPYASQDEMTTAVQSSINEAIDAGDLDGSTITEESIDSHLSTSLAGCPPLDIFVRTSGVRRLSGFLTWQVSCQCPESSNLELIFRKCCEDTQIHMVDAYWPEFGLFELVPIILEYQRKALDTLFSLNATMDMFDKFKRGAQRASVQATAFVKEGSSRVASGSRDFVQGFSLPGEADKAAKILASFLADPNHPESALNSVPKAVLQHARGLAVFQVIKAGFMFSGKAGSGLGWGLQIGADITDFVIVLNSEDAVRAFSIGGNVTIGGNVSAAAGPIGTGGSVQASLAHPASMFSYSKSKGLFAGLSLEGTVLIERKDANREFYGSPVPARDILGGRVPPPEVASRLYEIIEAAEGLDETGVPDAAYYPGTISEHIPTQGHQTVFDSEAH